MRNRVTQLAAVVTMMVVVTIGSACTSLSPPPPQPLNPTQEAWQIITKAQQYELEVGVAAGKAHAAGSISDSDLDRLTVAGDALDAAWRAATLSLVEGRTDLDVNIAKMNASKLQLQTLWEGLNHVGQR